MAAEVDYAMVDERLKLSYDYESGFHRYKGTPVQVVTKYNKDAVSAKKWFDELQHIVDAYDHGGRCAPGLTLRFVADRSLQHPTARAEDVRCQDRGSVEEG